MGGEEKKPSGKENPDDVFVLDYQEGVFEQPEEPAESPAPDQPSLDYHEGLFDKPEKQDDDPEEEMPEPKQAEKKKRLMLHVCCGPCSTHCIDLLKKDYDVTLHFYNPNIHPYGEYVKRFQECERVASEMEVPVEEGDYDVHQWLNMISGFEEQPEGATRCRLCFAMRLEKAASYAKEQGFDCFTTTLTISPHKDAERINEIGQRLAIKHGLEWVHSDFKKDDGFRKSTELSNRMGLYRQNYCGCFYSKRTD